MKAISENKRWKQTGKGSSRGFIMLPHFVLDSPQFAALPPYAVKLLLELARQFKGNNNGDLSATITALKLRGWSSEDTLWRYLTHLEETGWIVLTRQGGRYLGCNLYAITWWPIDDCKGKHSHQAERKASHLWKNAIATPKIGVRYSENRSANPVALQKSEREPIPLRPVA